MNARDHALYQIDRLHLPNWPRPLLKKRIPEPSDPRDRALSELIVVTVVKHAMTLQNLLSSHAHRPLRQIDPLIQKILAIAMAQLRYLTRVPASAAVDEAVNQTRKLGLDRASGFVNAVLRNATRDPDPALPDPATHPSDYARLAHSCPGDLYHRLAIQYSPAEALRIAAHANLIPPTIVRLSPGKSAEDLLALMPVPKAPLNAPPKAVATPALAEPDAEAEPVIAEDISIESDLASEVDLNAAAESAGVTEERSTVRPAHSTAAPRPSIPAGVQIKPHEQAGLVVVSNGRRANFATWSDAGIAQVQDATAASTVGVCDLKPGQRVLDRCCGLGTKTLQMAQVMQGSGQIVAIDPSGWRVKTLQALLRRRGIAAGLVDCRIAEWMHDALPDVPKPPTPEACFDRVLIDAPCSNSGVLARRPEARYAQSDKDMDSIIQLQRQIIDDTLPWVRPNGLLIYSTCSLWHDENHAQVARILKKNPRFVLLHERVTLPAGTAETPTKYHDGGFVAILHHHP